MSFLYPWGLLGLIGIPILIILYIIKNKYTEQIVPSTYLWTLSERFLKRKKRVSPLAGLIALLLQILAVTALSLAIAHPVFTLPNAANDYCFVLDASGSMNMVQDGKTRFEIGKAEIADVIEESANGSTYTLLCVGENLNVVYENLTDKELALTHLERMRATHTEVDMTTALERAQSYFSANPSLKTYLVSDTSYEKLDNVALINVAEAVSNYALQNVTYELRNSVLTVRGEVMGYVTDADVTIGLFIDDAQEMAVQKVVKVQNGQASAFELIYRGRALADDAGYAGIEDFSTLRLSIADDDALTVDDEYRIFNVKNESAYSILLVSDAPYMIEQVVRSLRYTHVDVVGTKDYESAEGYGLYIFDSFSPAEMPRDGSVMIINPTGEMTGAGFSVQNEILLDEGGVLDVAKTSSTLVQKLTAGLGMNDVYVSAYLKCGLNRNFTTVMSYRGSPVVFAGTNDYGNREVVLAFDLHKSNIAVLPDYLPFMWNLLEYCFPTVLDEVNYACGEEMTVNVIPNCESIRVESPTGVVSYLDTASAVGTVRLNEAGVWRVTLMVAGTERTYSVYSSLPEAEGTPTPTAQSFSLVGEAGQSYRDGILDVLIFAFICLMLMFAADWMVYCYEKYQLR